VLAVAGSEDVVIPPANLDALAARWPDCRTERFIGGGHAFVAQEPGRLAGLIRSFLGVP
jgi:pimeloyl-ACP methyl ester carboxylesterase